MCFCVELAFVVVVGREDGMRKEKKKVVRSIFYVYMKCHKVILPRDHCLILNSHQFLKASFNVLGYVTSLLSVMPAYLG